jgi:hypothetical protein
MSSSIVMMILSRDILTFTKLTAYKQMHNLTDPVSDMDRAKQEQQPKAAKRSRRA